MEKRNRGGNRDFEPDAEFPFRSPCANQVPRAYWYGTHCQAQCFREAVGQRKPGTIAFGCGEFKVLSVTSVATEGNKATVVFEREFAPSAVVEKVSDCKISQPSAGAATKTREFQRDDSGTWRMVTKG